MFFSQAKRIWAIYAVILVLVAGVLVWVSWFTIELDQRAEKSRQDVLVAEQEAAQQERIGRALWRLDWALSPLIAQEAARTHWMYQSFLPQVPQAGKGSKVGPPPSLQEAPQPSPLLIRPSPWVMLHFQLNEDSRLTSPQAPDGKLREVAMGCGVNPNELSRNCDRLGQIAGILIFKDLWESCSTTMLDQSEPALAWATTLNDLSPSQLAQAQSANALPQSLNDLEQSALPDLIDNSANAKQQANYLPSARGSRSQSIDYAQRGQAPNNIAVGPWQWNRYASAYSSASEKSVIEGSLKPVWVDQRLLLIRRIESPAEKLVQGCWLDWPTIRIALLKEIVEIIPEADLVPHTDDNQSRPALATLPVDLVAPMISPIQEIQSSSIARVLPLLAIAWSGFVIAAFSLGWLMWGITQLSERRAAFASAVTHELRTPLTTFRLYSEMLSSDMVSDPLQRQAYAAGLVKESDRLCRLVENVLQFARLERRQSKIHLQEIEVQELLAKTVERCRIRVNSAEMDFQFSLSESVDGLRIRTSPDLIEQILFNLVDNACKYAVEAEVKRVELSASTDRNWLVLTVRDYGPGIDAKMVKRLFRPFSRSSDETAGTAAGVGLGLSLSRQLANVLAGN